MKIHSLRIQNLRTIKDETIYFGEYTSFVGANGAGKSTVLCALNIFFGENESSPTNVLSLCDQDFHQRNVAEPISVTVTFIDLSDTAREEFKHYVRQDKLIVTAQAVYNSATKTASVKQSGERLGFEEFRPFFEAYKAKALVKNLKEIFANLCSQYDGIQKETTKEGMHDALIAYEAKYPEKCVPIPSDDLFYGATQGKGLLQNYVQWVYVPAVKDALQEEAEVRNSALGKLLSRTVKSQTHFDQAIQDLLVQTEEKYRGILTANQSALENISASLKTRLEQWAHPDASIRLSWQHEPAKSIRIDTPYAKVIASESDFEGDLARFGHGFQRSYLLALLQELANIPDAEAPTLILGCEEPELYQHPPQAKHLFNVFKELSGGNAQIMVTTHSPYFVSGENFESIRMVRRNTQTKQSNIKQIELEKLFNDIASAMGEKPVAKSAGIAKIHQALQPALNEIFFTQKLVLVEGLEDLSYINSWLLLNNLWDDFRKSGCHIVPTSGKSEIIRPSLIAMNLGIPVFAIADADGDKIAKPENKIRHAKDNTALLKIFSEEHSNAFPTEVIWGGNLVLWPNDIGKAIEADFLESLGKDKFEEIKNKTHLDYGHEGGLSKSDLFIGALIANIHEAGGTSKNLTALCHKIISF